MFTPFQAKLHLTPNLTWDCDCPGWMESIDMKFAQSRLILFSKLKKKGKMQDLKVVQYSVSVYPIPFKANLHRTPNPTSDRECPGWMESIDTKLVQSRLILLSKIQRFKRRTIKCLIKKWHDISRRLALDIDQKLYINPMDGDQPILWGSQQHIQEYWGVQLHMHGSGA